MEPIFKGKAGRLRGTISRHVSLGKTGISITRDLMAKLDKPNFLEVYKDNADLVCVPREVNGPNHLRRLNITNSPRGYYYCKTLSEHCNFGKFIFVLRLDKTLIIKNCIKRKEDDTEHGGRPRGRPRKNIFRRVS